MSYKKTGKFGLLILPCTNKRCSKCDSSLSNSLWKKKIVVFSSSRRSNNFLCVKCLQFSTGEKNHTPKDLDNFVFKQIHKPIGRIIS